MLLTSGNLCRQRLIPVWLVHPFDIVVISVAGYAEKLAYGLYRVLFPFSIDLQIFHRCFHLLLASRRNSRSSSFSIFRRRISFSFSCSIGTYPFGGLPRRRGMIPASISRIRGLYRLLRICPESQNTPRFHGLFSLLLSSPAFFSTACTCVYGLAIQKAPCRSYFPTSGDFLSMSVFLDFVHLSGQGLCLAL